MPLSTHLTTPRARNHQEKARARLGVLGLSGNHKIAMRAPNINKIDRDLIGNSKLGIDKNDYITGTTICKQNHI